MPTHFDQESHAHYLTFSCLRNLPLFSGPEFFDLFIQSLDRAHRRLGIKLYGFVIMPTHAHLLVYPATSIATSALLTAVKQPFAHRALEYLQLHQPRIYENLWTHAGARRVRRFWQERGGYNRDLFSVEAFEKTLDYMHLNPVRKGLVEAPEEWKWSSARFYKTGVSDLIELDLPDWR
jgi:putative transposase